MQPGPTPAAGVCTAATCLRHHTPSAVIPPTASAAAWLCVCRRASRACCFLVTGCSTSAAPRLAAARAAAAAASPRRSTCARTVAQVRRVPLFAEAAVCTAPGAYDCTTPCLCFPSPSPAASCPFTPRLTPPHLTPSSLHHCPPPCTQPQSLSVPTVVGQVPDLWGVWHHSGANARSSTSQHS